MLMRRNPEFADQRGHGAGCTSLSDPAAFAVKEFVADALAVLDHLDWQQPVICGASMGSSASTRSAISRASRC